MTLTKQQLDTLNEPTTIVIVMDGGIDSAIAQRWLAKHAPKVIEDARMYDELHVPHLQGNMTVCAVYRRPDTPALNYTIADQGRVLSAPRPDSETFAEVVVTQPIKVADYWSRPNPRTPGTIDMPRFMEALQASLLPMRMNYIDKGEQKPSILKLGTL